MKRKAKPARGTGGKGLVWDGFTPADWARMSLGPVTWSFAPAGSQINYAAEVGNGLGSSVLVALLCWLMRTFPEAPVIVERREQEQWRPIWNHALAARIREPNPYYSGRVLWMATVMEFAFGDAYWLKVRNGFGQVAELWWVPAALMKPRWDPADPNSFVDSYEYRVGGRTRRVPVNDVVHFQFGCRPDNPRLGFTPLAALVREIYVDEQASSFTAAVLRNLGILGVILSPTGSSVIPPDKLDALKEYVQQNFTGEKRGNAMAFSVPMEAKLLQYNLQGFDVGPIRDIAEERLSAALGIPAAVVGFGTGLQQTKVGATMRELIQQAWNGCIMPMQAILGETLDHQLLPDFQDNTSIFRTQFDTSDVRALREDEQQKAERLTTLAQGGLITVAEARKPLGFDVGPEHEVYYRPSSVVAVRQPGEQPAPPAAPAPSPTPTPVEESANDEAA